MSKPIDVKSTEVVPTRGKVVKTTPRSLPATSPSPAPAPPPSSPPKSPSPPPQQVNVTHRNIGTPSTSGATDTIVVCTLVIIGSALIKDVAHGQPSIKPVVTGMMLGGALLIMGTFAPTLAKLLAVTGLVGALMTNGTTLVSVGEKIK